MEPLPQKVDKEKGKKHLATFASSLFTVAFALTGCANLGRPAVAVQDDKPPTGAACYVATYWNHDVVVTPDPAHNGAPIPGIAGRVYLFGSGDSPLIGDGAVTVDLYDDSPKAAGKPPVLLEEWRINKDTLHQLVRKDRIGWGYTLFLPWGTYKPETSQVHLAVRFEPAKGTPLYAQASALSLDHSACATLVASMKTAPKPAPTEPAPTIVQTAARQPITLTQGKAIQGTADIERGTIK